MLLLIVVLLNGTPSVVFIGLILTLLTLIGAMYQPAVQASIPVLVQGEKLEQANGIVSGIGALSGMLGPVLGGVFYGLIGLSNLLVVSCIAFALSAIMEIFIQIPFTKPEQEGSMVATIFTDLKTGVAYMTREKPVILKIVILAAGLNMFLSAFLIVGAPYILRITLNSSDAMYTVGMALVEVATILGAISVGMIAKKMQLQSLHKWMFAIAIMLLPMAFAMTSGMLGLGYFPSFILFFLFATLIMVLATVISIYVITQVQRETPNELLGKIMAIIMAVAQCAAPLGQLLYGFLLEQFSAQVFIPVLVTGVMTACIGIAAKRMLNPKKESLIAPS